MLISTLSRPRWAMPEDRCLHRARRRRASRMASSIGIADSAPSSPKRFWPTYLVCEELLERLGGVEPVEDVALLVGATGSVETPSTCCWIQRFCSGSWMCMYSMPIGAAVGVAQHAEDVAERHARR